MPAGVAHRGDEPRADVVDLRSGLQEGEEHFLDEILGIAVRNAELATRNVEQEISMLVVQSLDIIGGRRQRCGRSSGSSRCLLAPRSWGGGRHIARVLFQHGTLSLAQSLG